MAVAARDVAKPIGPVIDRLFSADQQNRFGGDPHHPLGNTAHEKVIESTPSMRKDFFLGLGSYVFFSMFTCYI